MSRGRRHFIGPDGRPRCGVVSGRVEREWKRVDCLQCQVLRYLHARKEYDKRKAREAARLARPIPLLEEQTMQLPENVKAIIERYAARYPLPACVGCPVEQKEQAARQWTYGAVQQVVFELQGAGYGSKRSSRTAPLTKDKIARQDASGFFSWDIIIAAGSDNQSVNLNAEAENCAGQVFEPVEGVNLLGAPDTPKPGPSDPGPGPVESDDRIGTILHRLEGLEALLVSQQDRLDKALLVLTSIAPLCDKAAWESYNAAVRLLEVKEALAVGLEGHVSLGRFLGTATINIVAPTLQNGRQAAQQANPTTPKIMSKP